MEKAVFLTRNEIFILGSTDLSIALKSNDKRWDDIYSMIVDDKLRFVTVNPKLNDFNRMFKDCWYLISTIKYVNSTEHEDYIYAYFTYTFDEFENGINKGIRLLKFGEIDKFRKKLTI